jgi:hypothetical protein
MFGGSYFGEYTFAGVPPAQAPPDVSGSGDLVQTPAISSGAGTIEVRGGGGDRKKPRRKQILPFDSVFGKGRLVQAPAFLSGSGRIGISGSGNLQSGLTTLEARAIQIDYDSELIAVLELAE